MMIFIFWMLMIGNFSNCQLEPYDFPVLLPKTIQLAKSRANIRNMTTGKYIPQEVWIAVRNSSEQRAGHMTGPNGFVNRNSNWTVHFHGNEEKDSFMEQTFTNTSILWAYNILNPLLGTAKVEIWRLAILYLYGGGFCLLLSFIIRMMLLKAYQARKFNDLYILGLYMDDDANIGWPLDKIVQPDDKFIAGVEVYNWTDTCYVDSFALSNASFNLRYGEKNNTQVFWENKFWFNWALFSMPGNPLLLRIMEHIVTLIKAEYLNESLIKLSAADHRGKLLMCATTFPITLAAREMELEGRHDEIGLRIGGGVMFREYGADMKAWFNDHSPNHWVKMIHKRQTPYLRAYAPFRPVLVEDKPVQIRGHREIFLVKDLKRHVFPDWNTFCAMNFTLDNVHMLLPEAMDRIPVGDPLLPIKRR